jgi:esterase/lipase superfamily enzyme
MAVSDCVDSNLDRKSVVASQDALERALKELEKTFGTTDPSSIRAKLRKNIGAIKIRIGV